jgi:cytosine/adenosine deaminase-related metal-dependent hydrolase
MQSFGGCMPERSKSGMIVRARAVVTMDGPPVENGAVAISGDRIADVGRFGQIKAGNSGPVVDLGERALLPGLINAHCHLDYTCLRGKIPRQKSFTDWILAINLEKSKLGPEDYVASINEGFAEAKRFGTTTIVNLTAFPELIRKIPNSPIRTWWFAELIDVRSPNRTTQFVDSALESLTFAQNYGLAPHALFTASQNLYQRCNDAGSKVLLTTHLAESREEMEMFRNGSGPLYDFMKNIGRPMDDCGRETPIERFVDITGARALPRWLVAHLNELTKTDLKLLEKMRTKFHVAHSARSHHYFGHSRFPFKRLDAIGFNICLGTDSLASNESLSLFAEMRVFHSSEPTLPPEKIFEMVTVKPAFALRQQNRLGRIRSGFRADLIAIPCNQSDDLFEHILAFDGDVDWIMVNGRT